MVAVADFDEGSATASTAEDAGVAEGAALKRGSNGCVDLLGAESASRDRQRGHRFEISPVRQSSAHSAPSVVNAVRSSSRLRVTPVGPSRRTSPGLGVRSFAPSRSRVLYRTAWVVPARSRLPGIDKEAIGSRSLPSGSPRRPPRPLRFGNRSRGRRIEISPYRSPLRPSRPLRFRGFAVAVVVAVLVAPVAGAPGALRGPGRTLRSEAAAVLYP